MPELTILPLKGFAKLDFGATTEQAVSLFGQPDESEQIKDEITESVSLVYHYWEKGFSLFFNQEANLKLTCVEVDDGNATLWGEKVFEMKELEIIELFKRNGFKLTETENHEWGEKRLSFDDALTDLYLENGKLVSVNFGHMPDDKSFYFLPN